MNTNSKFDIKSYLLFFCLFFTVLVFSLCIRANVVSTVWTGTSSDAFEKGEGTIDNPYHIASAEQLALLSDIVSQGSDGFDAYYELDCDIYLNNVDDYDNWSSVAPSNSWNPIGTSVNSFKGYFDGNGFAIYGLYINDESLSNLGMFAYNEGTVCNVVLKNVYILGANRVGGICAVNNGSIDNCSVNGRIEGNNYVGGLCGQNGISPLEGTVFNCINESDIFGATYVGGIVGGISLNSSVFQCVNTGIISAATYIGGICGENFGIIQNSYNTGAVTGDKFIGGIYGANDSDTIVGVVTTNFNVGTIIGNKYVGAICGSVRDDELSHNYYVLSCAFDGVSVAQNGVGNAFQGFVTSDGAESTVGLDEEQLNDSSSFEGFDFNKVWTVKSDSAYAYPQLKGTDCALTQKHAWNDGETVVEPSCTQTGEKLLTCLVCYSTKTVKVPITHHFTEEIVSETTLASDATCTKKATYFYSCTCGLIGSDAFEYGETLPHTFDQQITSDGYCQSDATCTERATYYYSCICGEKGTETFESGDYAEHVYDKQVVSADYLASPATKEAAALYYYSCKCGQIGTETFVFGNPLPDATVSLINTSFKTAWNLDFSTEILVTQSSGTGAHFVLSYDPIVVTLKSFASSDGVEVEQNDNRITVTTSSAFSDGASLVTLTFTTSDELVSGEYDFITLTDDDNTATFDKLTIYQIGDVNMDGNVNARDALVIKQYAVKMVKLTDVQLVYADVNADQKVTARDSLLISQSVVHMKVTLGDRKVVSFVNENSTLTRSVHVGSDVLFIPDLPNDCQWSASEEEYVEPVFKNITEDKKYYARKVS